ncbi:MAG: hypothetical protein HY862_11645 [Chloroflexi bacterium]|nr:hypothetical protein [Chloroflexota bacterium]
MSKSATQEIVGHLSNGEFYTLAWSPTDDVLAIGGEHGIEIWDKDLQTILTRIDLDSVTSLSWNPNGIELVALSGDIFANPVRKLIVWNTSTGEIVEILDNERLFAAMEVNWSPDGSHLTTIGESYVIWETQTYQPIMELDKDGQHFSGGPGDPLSSWSPDGQKLAVVGNDNVAANYVIQAWDVKSGELIGNLESPTAYLVTVGWSPNGNLIAAGGEDKMIHIWDANSGRIKQLLIGHTDSVSSVSWSPDSKKIASAGWDGTVRLWEIE